MKIQNSMAGPNLVFIQHPGTSSSLTNVGIASSFGDYMRRIKPAILFLAVLLFMIGYSATCLSANDPPQSEKKFITFVRGTSDDIFASGNKATARFPITLQGVQPDAVKFRIVDVVLGKTRESRFVGAFTPKMELAKEEGRSQALIVDVDLTKASVQGTYNLYIEASAADGSRQPLELQIVAPAAKLRPTGTLVVQNVVPIFKPEYSPLFLMENSGRSQLTDVTFSRLPSTNDGNQSINGQIEFGKLAEPILPNGKAPVDYNLKGDFSLGTTKGSVDVTAPQLAEPLSINYEVRTHLCKGFIILFIFIGLSTGYIIRTLLKNKIQLNSVRLNSINLQQRISAEIGKHYDENFRKVIKDKLKELESATKTANADDLTKLITDTDKVLADVLNDLQQRRLRVQIKLDEIDKLIKTPWRLPDSIQRHLTTINGKLEETHQLFDNDDVKSTDSKLDEIRASLSVSLDELERTWRDYMNDYLGKLSEPNAFLPASLSEKLQQAIVVLNPKLSQMSGVKLDANIEEICANLAAIHDARMNADSLMRQLGSWLQIAKEEVLATLSQAQVPDNKTVEHLNIEVKKFSEKAANSPADPQKALEDLPNDLEELHNAWSAALLKQVPETADDVANATVLGYIDSRNYSAAARMIVQQTAPTAGSNFLGVMPLGSSEASSIIQQPFSPWLANLFSTIAPVVITRIKRPVATYEALEVQLVRTKMELFKDTLFQTILVFILLTMVGYLLYADKFIGTLQDFGSIFFWAFSIDITVDALVQAAGKIPKPS